MLPGQRGPDSQASVWEQLLCSAHLSPPYFSAATTAGRSSFHTGGEEVCAQRPHPRECGGTFEGRAQSLGATPDTCAPLSSLTVIHSKGPLRSPRAPCARTTPCPCSAESWQDSPERWSTADTGQYLVCLPHRRRGYISSPHLQPVLLLQLSSCDLCPLPG